MNIWTYMYVGAKPRDGDPTADTGPPPAFYFIQSRIRDVFWGWKYSRANCGRVLSEGYGHDWPGVCLGDGQTEAFLKDMGMTGLASVWAMARRRRSEGYGHDRPGVSG